MADKTPKILDDYLALQYPLQIIADPYGGYVARFPDLPGCLTQGETLEEVVAMAEEARAVWIETVFEDGMAIPLPSYPEDYSGKFNLRLPRSLHRELAESAEAEGVSLNQYVCSLLARRDAEARVEQRLAAVDERLSELAASLVTSQPVASQ